MNKNKNNQTIWNARIKKNTSTAFQKIGSSISIDKKLYKEENISRGHFIDIFTGNGYSDCARFLVANSLKFFDSAGVDEVTLWMQGSPFFQDIIGEFDFHHDGLSGGGWAGSTRSMICRFNIDPEKFRPYLNEKDWYFTMGDTLEIY